MAKPTYQAVCERCYTCVLITTTSKREAEQTATSHMSAYGHTVHITEPLRVPKDETEQR